MRTRLLASVGLTTAVVTITGCGAFSSNPTDRNAATATPEAVVDRLTTALSTTRGLRSVPLTDIRDAERLATLIAPLRSFPVEVTAGDIRADDGSASVPLHWRWRIAEHVWAYDAQAHLVEGDRGWAVDWSPSTLEPSLGVHDVLAVDRLEAERGDVIGAHGTRLVTMRPVLRYGLDKSAVAPAQAARSARRIADELGVDAAPYQQAVASAGSAAFVEALVLRREDAREQVRPTYTGIPGAIAVADELPLAPTRDFAAPLLGTAGPATAEVIEESKGRVLEGDLVGLSGLQARYDDVLAGRPGLQVSATPRQRCRSFPQCPSSGEARVLTSQAPVAGKPIRLTLDPALQRSAEETLAATGGERAPASAIVAIRPSTGEVLAAANGPGNGGLNAATFGTYAPGSTFKVVTALALLRSGLTPDQVVSCPATIDVDGKTFKNYDDYPADRIGSISLTTAIANSCNTALIGERQRLGPSDLADAAAALGLGVDHDLGFPAYFGQVPRPDSETEAAADLIGQGKVLAGPLAMATVAASVAAGHAVVPTLVVDPAAPSRSATEPDRPLTPAEARSLQDMMRAVVTEGSGRFLAELPGDVGAKTGTAEYGPPTTDGSSATHAWMIATQGDLAVAVFVETGLSGSQTAGPLLEHFLR